MYKRLTLPRLTITLWALPWLFMATGGPSPTVPVWLFAIVASTCGVLVMRYHSRLHGYGTVVGETQGGIICAKAWLAASILSVLIALTQYFGVAIGLPSWVNAATVGEAYGNLRQRNQFATLTSIGFLAALSLLSFSLRQSGPFKLSLFFGLLACGNAASGSRTGLGQWVVVVALVAVWSVGKAKRSLHWALATLVMYLWACLILPVLLQSATGVRAMSSIDRVQESVGSCQSRLTLWSNVLHLITQKPWLGWGWGELDYAHFITLYPGERFCEILDNAHNLPLHLAVELGVPVALVFFATCGWLVWRNRPWAETNPTRQLAWGVLAVIGLHSMLEYPLWYGPFQLAVVLCIWMLWVTPMNADADEKGSVPPRESTKPSALAIAVATILIAACVYAAWDYWRISQIYLAPESRNATYRDDTLAKIQNSRLFQDQVKFAELTITPLTQDNAGHTYELAKAMLHFSPEPRVVEKVIESATMLGREDEALFYLQRFKAAFPEQHSRWSAALKILEQD